MPGPAEPPLGDTLERAVGASVLAGLRRDPAFLDPMIERGALDPRFAAYDPGASDDPVALAAGLGRAVGRAVQDDPGLVAALGLDPLDLLRRDAVGPAALVARAPRSARAVAAALLSGGVPAAEVARSRGGSLVRHLGEAHLMVFGEPRAAVRALLDLRDADPSLRAALDAGEVSSAGAGVYGRPVGQACALAAAAGPGEVLLSARARDPIGDPAGVALDLVAARAPGGDAGVAWTVRRA